MELLLKRKSDLLGILNGIDEDIYDPETVLLLYKITVLKIYNKGR